VAGLILVSGRSVAEKTKLTLHGRPVVGGIAEGEALVTSQTISGFGGIEIGRAHV
jgi:predicted aconitase with swiveling domain